MLQNAIDWASRPPDQPFKGKPVAIMGASTGRHGDGAGCSTACAATLDSLEAHALLKPEVMIAARATAFDETGLVDEKAREVVAAQMTAFDVWIRRFRSRSRGPARRSDELATGRPAQCAVRGHDYFTS